MKASRPELGCQLRCWSSDCVSLSQWAEERHPWLPNECGHDNGGREEHLCGSTMGSAPRP